MISGCGFSSVPPEISVWVAAEHLRREFDAQTGRVDTCIHSLQGGVSGGALISFIGVFDFYGFRKLYRMHSPFALSLKKTQARSPTPTKKFKDQGAWSLANKRARMDGILVPGTY